jgi:flagellar biosynthesis chaperone FliJ
LQRYLDVTDKRELAVKAELFSLCGQIAERQSELARRKRMMRDLLGDLRSRKLQDRLMLQESLMASLHTEQQRLDHLQEQIAQLEEQRDEKIRQLAELTGRKDGLNRLREEACDAYRRDLDRRQQASLDELFQINFARRLTHRQVKQAEE